MFRTIAMLVAQAPTPKPDQPPGTQGLATLLNWLAWLATFAAVAGLLVTASLMALSHRRGEGSEHLAHLGMVLAACVVVAASGALVGALV